MMKNLGHISSPKDLVTKEYVDGMIDNIGLSNAVRVTLLASAWENNQQVVPVNGLEQSQNGIASLPQTITYEEMEAAIAASIFISAQSAGSLTFYCNGDIPQINIPVVIILLG